MPLRHQELIYFSGRLEVPHDVLQQLSKRDIFLINNVTFDNPYLATTFVYFLISRLLPSDRST
jgi:hypothetical protein